MKNLEDLARDILYSLDGENDDTTVHARVGDLRRFAQATINLSRAASGLDQYADELEEDYPDDEDGLVDAARTDAQLILSAMNVGQNE